MLPYLLFRSVYECPAPGRSSLYDLDRGKSRTGLSLNSFYYNYDAPRSTLTYQLHYDEPQFVMDKRPETRYCTVTSGLTCKI